MSPTEFRFSLECSKVQFAVNTIKVYFVRLQVHYIFHDTCIILVQTLSNLPTVTLTTSRYNSLPLFSLLSTS